MNYVFTLHGICHTAVSYLCNLCVSLVTSAIDDFMSVEELHECCLAEIWYSLRMTCRRLIISTCNISACLSQLIVSVATDNTPLRLECSMCLV